MIGSKYINNTLWALFFNDFFSAHQGTITPSSITMPKACCQGKTLFAFKLKSICMVKVGHIIYTM